MNPDHTSRPLGLTLLAITNFAIGGIFGIYALLGLISLGVTPTGDVVAPEFSEVLPLIIIGSTIGLLGIISGGGCIARKRLLGRRLATAYGVVGTVSWCLLLALKGRAFVAMDAVYISAFVANAVLVNTIYKASFVEP